MRVFQDIYEAHKEITRDLAKSPLVKSNRVQNQVHEGEAREALNYAYTILDLPSTLYSLVNAGVGMGIYKEQDVDKLLYWFKQEQYARTVWEPGRSADQFHPALQTVIEGQESSYLYTDRLRDAAFQMSHLLRNQPDSRRAFWPIFHPEDAVRAERLTRIPCSLGYQGLIREVNGQPTFHLTYLMRSCDFGTFWLSDLWFARQFQRQVHKSLDRSVQLGSLSHIILSFHSFISGEIY